MGLAAEITPPCNTRSSYILVEPAYQTHTIVPPSVMERSICWDFSYAEFNLIGSGALHQTSGTLIKGQSPSHAQWTAPAAFHQCILPPAVSRTAVIASEVNLQDLMASPGIHNGPSRRRASLHICEWTNTVFQTFRRE